MIVCILYGLVLIALALFALWLLGCIIPLCTGCPEECIEYIGETMVNGLFVFALLLAIATIVVIAYVGGCWLHSWL